MHPIPTRYLTEIGTIHYLRRYWEDDHPCQGWSYHNAMKEIARTYVLDDYQTGGNESDHADSEYPKTCTHCGHVGDATGKVQVFHRRLYRAPDGSEVSWEALQPGDLFYVRSHLPAAAMGRYCPGDWGNCDGRHLHCVLPTGLHWDIDGRASNCDMASDALHRCWVRHGDPELGQPVTVDKAGLTCHAGAGSIAVPGWHGFLRQGHLTT